MSRRLFLTLAALVLATAPACSDDLSSTSSTTAPSVPGTSELPATSVPQDLADMLLQPVDLGTGWSTVTDTSPLDFEIGAERCQDQVINAVIIDRIQPAVGTILATADERLSVREMLVTGEAGQLSRDFRVLVDGTMPCLGRTETAPDGEQVTYEALATPDLGDDSFAMRVRIAEPPGFEQTWTIRMIGVLVDDVVVVIDQIEIPDSPAAAPTLDDDQFVAVVERAVELVRDGG